MALKHLIIKTSHNYEHEAIDQAMTKVINMLDEVNGDLVSHTIKIKTSPMTGFYNVTITAFYYE